MKVTVQLAKVLDVLGVLGLELAIRPGSGTVTDTTASDPETSP